MSFPMFITSFTFVVAFGAGLVLTLTAYYIGKRAGAPSHEERWEAHHRARFLVWLKRLWGIEDALVYTWENDREGLSSLDIDTETVRPGLSAANVYCDPQDGLLPWVLHTSNLAVLRLQEIQQVARTRGPKFSDRQEKLFQALLKDARYLDNLCRAALFATPENYAQIRPAILAGMKRYPDYTPAGSFEPSTPAPLGELPAKEQKPEELQDRSSVSLGEADL